MPIVFCSCYVPDDVAIELGVADAQFRLAAKVVVDRALFVTRCEQFPELL
ncbi:hypothetical protein G9H49_22665 [Escherichia coli]|nr:hypothetical protein [Escherichia coli]EJC6625081.1 hypothetical protein [Escherichia coli]EUC83089.1 hypothetical protein HMPREF1570_5014 [Klebsiella oxytoca KA-2]MBA1701823.1 hypothetical protein [Escherichia coli]